MCLVLMGPSANGPALLVVCAADLCQLPNLFLAAAAQGRGGGAGGGPCISGLARVSLTRIDS